MSDYETKYRATPEFLAWQQEHARQRYLHTFGCGDTCSWEFVTPADCGCCGFGAPGWRCTGCGDWLPADMPDLQRNMEKWAPDQLEAYFIYAKSLQDDPDFRWVRIREEVWFGLSQDERDRLMK